MFLVFGCNENKKTDAAKANAALDVSAAPAYQAAPAPVATPMVTETPVIAPAPAAQAAPISAGGQTYVVKKGDYLYKIVREHYNGDLKQVPKVKAANPGIDYEHLRPGDKLVLP
jgi:nucleoid-associated protein YgaU